MKVKKTTLLALWLSFGVFCISACYYSHFHDALNRGIYQCVDGFTRIIIPDTFLYKDIIHDSDVLQSIVYSSVKNTIGPSFIWVVAQSNWILVSLLNSLMLLMALTYQARIARLLGISERRIVIFTVVLALLPATLYHSVGALKEIPTLLCLLGFLYHYLKRERVRWVVFAILLVVFRYQLILVVGSFLVVARFRKQSLLVGAFILLTVSAIYPYIRVRHDVFVQGTMEAYRAGQENTAGAHLEFIRQHVPILSAVAVFCRIGQSILGYFVSFLRNPASYFYEDDCLSIIRVIYFTSHLILVCYWFRWFKSVTLVLFHSSGYECNAVHLLLLGLLYVVPVGGMSFIHPRYLYPVIGIILLGTAVAPRSAISSCVTTVLQQPKEDASVEVAPC